MVRQATYFFLLLLATSTLIGCSDTRSSSEETLEPAWTITVDHAIGTVLAKGSVRNSYTDVRLTDGDVMRVSWGAQLWQLYRVDAPLVYVREFAIPDNRNRFEARLDRIESSFTPIVYDVVLPDVQTAALVEENLEIPETGSLNFSWDLGSTPVSLISQSIRSQLLDCETSANENASSLVFVDNDVRSITIDLQSLSQPAPSTSGACRYSLQLIIDTFVDKPESVSVQTRSRLFETSIDFAGIL